MDAVSGKRLTELCTHCAPLPSGIRQPTPGIVSREERRGVRFCPAFASGLRVSSKPSVDILCGRLFGRRPLVPSSGRATRVRAALPQNERLVVDHQYCANQPADARPWSRPTVQNRGRSDYREEKTRPPRRSVAECHFGNAGSSTWSGGIDVRRARTNGRRILGRDIRRHAPPRFRQGKAEGRHWQRLSGGAWSHVTPIHAFVRSASRRLVRAPGFTDIAQIFLVRAATVEDV